LQRSAMMVTVPFGIFTHPHCGANHSTPLLSMQPAYQSGRKGLDILDGSRGRRSKSRRTSRIRRADGGVSRLGLGGGGVTEGTAQGLEVGRLIEYLVEQEADGVAVN